MNEAEFNKMFWAAQPPEVQALEVNTTPDQDVREPRAIELATKGFKIDLLIMVYGWSPFKVMTMRQDAGYTWTPNLLQPPVQIAPGLSLGTLTNYDPAHPPGGAWKVSLDPKDYPPFPKPQPPKPTAGGTSGVEYRQGNPVGVKSAGRLYYHNPNVSGYKDGDEFEDERGKFLFHVYITPFGSQPIWELQPPPPATQ